MEKIVKIFLKPEDILNRKQWMAAVKQRTFCFKSYEIENMKYEIERFSCNHAKENDKPKRNLRLNTGT